MKYEYPEFSPFFPDGKLDENITREKREHPMWLRHQWIANNYTEKFDLYFRKSSIIGHWQYIYKSKKGQISLIELPNHLMDGIDYWEICGAMTPDGDVERFHSKSEAEVRIKELLD